jgi:tyrosinase
MGIRKNQATLTATEKARFIAAVLQLKASGIYDRYVADHRDAMQRAPMLAHGGSAFLPWHRELLRRFELDLQRVDSSVTLPYWDWTADRSPASSLWAADFMGGDGEAGSLRVTTGPFAFANGRWNINVASAGDPGPALRRALGQNGRVPSTSDVNSALARVPYDRSPWVGPMQSFRYALEVMNHDQVHNWVGGSMATATSPNDPIFFLHHANVDRLWSRWQDQHPGEPFYLPTTGGRTGQNLNDPMPPWGGTATPASVVNHRTLGYTYDDDPPPRRETELLVGAAPLPAAIERPGEIDEFSFVAPATGIYTIETEGPTDVVMSLFGPNNRNTFITEDDDGGQSSNARIVRQLTSGTYHVRVRHYQAASTGNYGISVQRNGIPSDIPEIQINGPAIAGEITANNESDIFTFNASAAGRYTIATTGNTDTFMTLLGPNNQTQFIAEDDDGGVGRNSRIVADLSAGDYFVRVRHYSATGRGSYRIAVTG